MNWQNLDDDPLGPPSSSVRDASSGTSVDAITIVHVEDDARLARLTSRYLASHGIHVTIAANGNSGVETVLRERPDVVLLDLTLPGMDGLAVCRELRRRVAIPIIMVSARVEEDDRVLSLEWGADDYVAKPFSSRELLARIHAHARRARRLVGPTMQEICVGELLITPRAMNATMCGVPLSLTTYEFMLLRVLAERAGRVLSREQLVDLVRGNAEDAFDRSIDVHISHLRRKLGDDPKSPALLKTVRGIGYVFAPDGGYGKNNGDAIARPWV